MIYVKDILLTIIANAIATNVTSTMLTNSADKNLRHKMNFYILHTVL